MPRKVKMPYEYLACSVWRVDDAARTIILGALMQIDATCLSNVNRDIVKRNQSVHALPVVLDKVLHYGFDLCVHLPC